MSSSINSSGFDSRLESNLVRKSTFSNLRESEESKNNGSDQPINYISYPHIITEVLSITSTNKQFSIHISDQNISESNNIDE